jgi:hypothetical protein
LGAAAPSRLGFLLRWLGITLVVLLVLQLLVISPSSWGEQGYRQQLVERLVSQSPMALVGLLLMLFGARLDQPGGSRPPLGWLVGLLAILLAVANIAAVPVLILGDQTLTSQADQQLAATSGQLAMARSQLNNPQALDQFVSQAEQAGQIPPNASADDKRKFVKQLLERQLQQAEGQLKQQRQARDVSVNQRRIGGIGAAVVLAISFVLIALAALVMVPG